mmetsp:Transcript_46350/g.149392  ORF Transcript_46350/g.149392 Transcript_46350/m.149392 type:complete len:224 (+) Transcript_46350:893-1564(+)
MCRRRAGSRRWRSSSCSHPMVRVAPPSSPTLSTPKRPGASAFPNESSDYASRQWRRRRALRRRRSHGPTPPLIGCRRAASGRRRCTTSRSSALRARASCSAAALTCTRAAGTGRHHSRWRMTYMPRDMLPSGLSVTSMCARWPASCAPRRSRGRHRLTSSFQTRRERTCVRLAVAARSPRQRPAPRRRPTAKCLCPRRPQPRYHTRKADRVAHETGCVDGREV